MATGEIRVSILWEWLHKGAPFTEADSDAGVGAGDTLTPALFARLLDEEYAKLLAAANRDVHDDSKGTTLPIARDLVAALVESPVKAPWYIDLLNLTLDNTDRAEAARRVAAYMDAFTSEGRRITANPEFDRG